MLQECSGCTTKYPPDVERCPHCGEPSSTASAAVVEPVEAVPRRGSRGRQDPGAAETAAD